MLTGQQKMLALLKTGEPVGSNKTDSLRGSPAFVSRELTVGDNLLGGSIYDAFSDLVAEAKASMQATSQLTVSQQHGSKVAHDSAKGTVALLSGLPPNLEGVPLTDPYTEEGSPISPGAEDIGAEDTDVLEKQFVN